MKSTNKKTFCLPILIFILTVVACLILKVLAFSIPSEIVKKNVEKSQITIENTGDYPILAMWNSSYEWIDKGWNISDFYTEWMMVNVAYNVESDHPLKSSMLNTRIMSDTSNASLSLLNDMNSAYTLQDIDNPVQYWLGSAAIIRILLYFYDYSQILTLLHFMFGLLIFLTSICLYRRTQSIGTSMAFILALYCISATTVSFSFTYGMVFIVAFLFIIVICNYCSDLSNGPILFLVVGTITAFIDWMSTPSVTCTLPLAVFIVITYDTTSFSVKDMVFKRLLNIINCGMSWCIGYAGMLMSKWFFSMIFTNENIIQIVQKRVLADSGVEISNKIQYYFEILNNYFKMLTSYKLNLNWIWCVIIIITIIGFLWKVCSQTSYSLYIELLIISIVPFIWPIVLMWHSHEHYWFTYRNLVVTIFVGFELFIYTLMEVRKQLLKAKSSKL